MQRYGVLYDSGSDSGQHLLHWLYMFVSWGTIYFPLASIFLFLPFYPLQKQRKTSLLCTFFEESISHSNQIRKKKKKNKPIYQVTLMGMLLWQGLSWKWEKQRHLEVEGLCSLGLHGQQSTLNHLIAGEFPSCHLDHSALVERRHITCSLCLLESWVKCCFN